MKKRIWGSLVAILLSQSTLAMADPASLQPLIARHAADNNVPETLIHRVIRRESNYNPQIVGRGGALGLMQIKYATARGMGYAGSPSGLLDPNTNLTYAVRYLAGAYRVAGGNENRAVGYYAGGYYYAAKRLGTTAAQAQQPSPSAQQAHASEIPKTAPAHEPPMARTVAHVPSWAEMR